MKASIVVLLFLFISCSKNPVAPVEHTFYSGDISSDFSILVKTTNYYDIGEGAEVGVIVGMKTIFTIKDKRPRSVRETDRIKTISYWKNNSLLSDTGKQALMYFDEGRTDIAVEITTVNGSFIINAYIFGMKGEIPKPLTVGNFPRGVLCSDRSIQEELVLLEEYLALDSAGWVTTTVSRFASGYWHMNRYNIRGASENGISKRMFEFINSNIDSAKYAKAIDWAYLAIMFSSAVNPDSVEPFYLRYIIESPHLNKAAENSQSLDLLAKRDHDEFINLVYDIINNPSSYADKSAMDSVSLVDIALEKRNSLP
ncbi:MAG: hypothetical protein PHE24_06140 [Patescibacteria group bacterium]|nr:hypothetical protein [Patescibacteria group bacterium]